MYKIITKIIKVVEEKNRVEKPVNFFLNSMSDETYLDMIRERIEFLIDDGYKYSEQLEIINRESGRNIKHSAYTNFVKLFVLEKPENVFQNREFQRFYKNYQGSDNGKIENNQTVKAVEKEITKTVPRESSNFADDFNKPYKETSKVSKIEKPVIETESVEKGSVQPLKRKVKQADRRESVSFQHQAMPDVNELY